MTSLAVKAPVAMIASASGLGAVMFAEATPVDYATPGVIISVLFAFIGTCSVILYKVVLAPLFTVFINNLQNFEEERRTTLKELKEKLEILTDYVEDQKDKERKG